jgi:hypothetical protein
LEGWGACDVNRVLLGHNYNPIEVGSVEEFTKLMKLMIKSEEKFFVERKINWERSFDPLVVQANEENLDRLEEIVRT